MFTEALFVMAKKLAKPQMSNSWTKQVNENTNPRRILRDEKEKTTEATWIKLLHAVLYKQETEKNECGLCNPPQMTIFYTMD